MKLWWKENCLFAPSGVSDFKIDVAQKITIKNISYWETVTAVTMSDKNQRFDLKFLYPFLLTNDYT